jgi:signal transduction histidine kinase
LFVLLSAIPLAAFGWLGWRTLKQDREIETDRKKERLDDAAGLLTREFDRALTAWEDLLRSALQNENSSDLPAGAVLVVFDSRGIVSRQGVRLPYYPVVPAPAEVPEKVFAAAQSLEYAQGNLEGAASAYRDLAEATDRRIRAAALMRLDRVLRAQEKTNEALTIYGRLAILGDTPAERDPAELVARRERIALFNKTGNRRSSAEETALLTSALSEGRFLIDHATFDFYSESASAAGESASRSFELAEAFEKLWPLWQDEASGRKTWNRATKPLVTLWRKASPSDARTAAIVGSLESLAAPAMIVAGDLRVRLSLEDPGGGLLPLPSSATPAGQLEAVRTYRETDLSWTLHVTDVDVTALTASRRDLLATGFALMVLVIAASGYFVFRAVSRELGVARLQSEFVAAVSHEFRTPLTAMRHLTEMLEEGGVPGERLSQYYRTLGRETRRLHEMVENLLDFGRMEAGRQTYHMEETNASELAASVVEDFQERSALSGHRLDWTPPETGTTEANGGVRIRADREALTLALRNLIDNALKYSPESSTVSVSVNCRNGIAGISVEDCGAGISSQEHRQIFKKFVRGASAKDLNVKGTGIGLAMADEIVRAHGGRLELASQLGRGSRFTILLPTEMETAHDREKNSDR